MLQAKDKYVQMCWLSKEVQERGKLFFPRICWQDYADSCVGRRYLLPGKHLDRAVTITFISPIRVGYTVDGSVYRLSLQTWKDYEPIWLPSLKDIVAMLSGVDSFAQAHSMRDFYHYFTHHGASKKQSIEELWLIFAHDMMWQMRWSNDHWELMRKLEVDVDEKTRKEIRKEIWCAAPTP